jgi:integrase
MTFTELALLRLKPPQSGQIEYWDAGSKGQLGLRVLVSSGGTKTYRSTFYLHGKACARALGRVGELDLAIARERVRADRKLASEGIDPRQQMKEQRKANQINYDHVVDQFVEHYCKPRQWTWDRTQRVLKNCEPLLKRPIRAITKVEVKEMLRSFVTEGHPAKADMARSLLTTLFKWAVQEDYLTSSIMESVSIDIEKGSRERVYTDDEIKAIWQAANKLDANTSSYVKLMVLLAPRKTALALLSCKQLDNLDNPTLWTTTAEAVKARKSARKKRVYLTPLPQLAQRIVKALLKDRDNARLFAQLSVYMTKAGRLNFDGKALAAQLIELGAPADFAYHTMRHTVTTFLQNDGVDEWSRGLILNHAGSGSVTGDYSHG